MKNAMNMVAVPVMKARKNCGVHSRQPQSICEAVGHSYESGHSHESVCLRGFCKSICNDATWATRAIMGAGRDRKHHECGGMDHLCPTLSQMCNGGT